MSETEPGGSAAVSEEKSVEQAARAYPVEVEHALHAWIAENERLGWWVSPAGWWYAGWKYGSADLEAAQKRQYEWEQATLRAQADFHSVLDQLQQSRATEAELRAKVAEQEGRIEFLRDWWTKSGAVVRAAKAIDPKDRSFAMDDALAALDATEQPARAEEG